MAARDLYEAWGRRAMADQGIRWLQRLSNYKRALGQLTRVVALAQTRSLSELERQGLFRHSSLSLSWPGV